MDRIRIGVSSCLLGNKVRYDGRHKKDPFITGMLAPYCEFVPVCPELECGLPVPREPMRLEGPVDKPHLITELTRIDHTERMLIWISRRLDELERDDLAAFIFKSKSPSSGLRNIKIHKNDGRILSNTGQGLFARTFTERFPDIPVEDENGLLDVGIRENFIERIFTLQRWRSALSHSGANGFVEFHSRHKYALMAHSQTKARELGRIVARLGDDNDLSVLRTRYRKLLGETLAIRRTKKNVFNVLLHIIGYFKKNLSAIEKAEILAAAEQYHQGLVPLNVALELINHYVFKYSQSYLEIQTFLRPHPVEMGLFGLTD